MAKQIFRQAALDRLASPERLDRPYRLVTAPVWLALAAIFGAILIVAVWSVFAEAPVKVAGSGIVLPEEGLLEIVADANGRIQTLSLSPGGVVAEGETIATFSRSDLSRDLIQARAELLEAKARLQELTAFFKSADALERAAEDERLATIRQIQSYAARRGTLMRQKIKSLKGLVARKIVIRDRLIDAELQLAEARERLASLDDEAKSIGLGRLKRQNEQKLSIIDEERKVQRLNRQAAKLEGELSEKRVSLSPHSGRVIEVRVNRGDVVSAGSTLATLVPKDLETGQILGVLYLAPADGKRIKVGMAVEVEPATVRAAEHGFILAEVVAVSPVPVSLAGMQNTLKNDQLAKELSGGSAPFEIKVRFQTDVNTASGLAWSSSKGPPAAVLPGTSLKAKVIVERKRLIDLLIPGASALADG